MIKILKKEQLLKGYKFIDLFAGIGGFHYALKSYGANCVFASEKDVKASEIYFQNHKNLPFGDITQIKEEDIPNHDILCAGFPCQAFSISGKQRGFEDARGTLFFEIARIVKQKSPQILILENVKNFARHNDGRTLKTVVNILEGLNYTIFYQILNTSNFGLPQNRERIYIIGFNKSFINSPSFKFPNLCIPSALEDILEDSPIDAKVINRDDISFYKSYIPKIDLFGNTLKPNKPIQIGKVNKGGQGERIYHPFGHSVTLSANGGGIGSKTGMYKINDKIRKLSPRECARLQGFPENFKFHKSRSQAYKHFGNSVSIDVLQHIIKEITLTINQYGQTPITRFSNSKKWVQKRKRYSNQI